MGSLLLTETDTTLGMGWRSGLTAVSAADDPLVIVSDGRREARVGSGTPLRATLLELLGSPAGTPLELLVAEAADAACDGDRALAEVEARSLLNRLAGFGLLAAWLADEQGVAATIATPVLPDEPLEPAGSLELSPDAFVRRNRRGELGLVLESAADPARSDPIEPRFATSLLTGELPPAWHAALRHAGILVAGSDTRPRRSRARGSLGISRPAVPHAQPPLAGVRAALRRDDAAGRRDGRLCPPITYRLGPRALAWRWRCPSRGAAANRHTARRPSAGARSGGRARR